MIKMLQIDKFKLQFHISISSKSTHPPKSIHQNQNLAKKNTLKKNKNDMKKNKTFK